MQLVKLKNADGQTKRVSPAVARAMMATGRYEDLGTEEVSYSDLRPAKEAEAKSVKPKDDQGERSQAKAESEAKQTKSAKGSNAKGSNAKGEAKDSESEEER